jgi:Bacterial Ig-like domain (group 3)/FG-GAP-like repeat
MFYKRALVCSLTLVIAVFAIALHAGPAPEVKGWLSSKQPEAGMPPNRLHAQHERRFGPQQSSSAQGNLSLPAYPQSSAIFLQAPTFDSGGVSAMSIAVADVNGDGKPDLVIANRCGSNNNCPNGTVSVLLNNGDGTFQPAVSYADAVGYSPISVAVGDVNGDGKPDIVVASLCTSGNCTSDVIGVLLGNGDGTFQPAVSYGSGGLSPYAVAVADVNGDGKADILVANSCLNGSNCDGGVAVLLGKGDGTFQPAVSYDSGGLTATSIAVADVNGDGKPDLLVTNMYAGNGNYSRGSVGVLLGNGDGTFKPAVSYDSGGEYAYSVAVADVNADGKPDLLVANYCADSACATGGVGVFLGNGDGTFKPAVSYDSGGQVALSVAVADVNGDGRPDLIVANQCTSGLCHDGAAGVLLGNGDGTFQAAISYDSGGNGTDSVAVADANGDGKLDLLVLNQGANPNGNPDGRVAVLLGRGDGTFQGALTFAPGGDWAYSVAVGDVNGDGKPDLIVADQLTSGGAIAVLLGKGDGTFQPAVSYSSGGRYAESVAIADVNHDGKLDLLVANYDGTVGVLLGNGDGTFHAVVTYSSGGNYSYSVAVADVNGDGQLDLLVANGCLSFTNCATGGVGVLLGKGDGTFQPAVSYASGGQNAFSVAVADVNGDGKPDLMLANEYVGGGNYSNGTIGVLLGNGDGTFQPAASYSSGAYTAYSVAAGDVNGDGKPDLLVSNGCVSSGDCANGTIGMLLGNGDGTFQTATTIATPPLGSGALVLADLNGDGKLDVASGAGSFLLLGNGDGTFQSPLVLGAGGMGIAVGDFNRDGTPDLAVGGVAVLLNITKTWTTTTLVSSQNPSVYGQSVTFTATVMPQGSGTPTGTVTFTDGGTTLGKVSISGGSATLSTSKLPAGTHSIAASYSGDSNFGASVSPALAQTVNQATTTTALVSSANPSYVNQAVTFTATVTPQYGGALTGSVTFKQGTTTLATVTLANGQATYTTTYTSTGTRSITAVYSGDGNNQGSTSAVLKQVVNSLPAATTTLLTTSGTPSFINQPVTFTATVTSTYGPIPVGELVTFKDGTATLASVPLAVGVATYTTSSLKKGSHAIKATYAGDATFKSSSGTLTQVVNLYPSTTTVSSSLNPSTYGQSVTLTATVTSTAPSAAAGTVTFKNGTTSLGTATLNASGVATLTKANLPAGTNSITGVYPGDSETTASTSAALVQTVNPAVTSTTIDSSPNPSAVGKTVIFTSQVSSPTTVPTGTVTFMDWTTALATVNLNKGKASYSTSALSAGSHNMTAVYNGTPNINRSTSPILVQMVN